MNILNDTEHRIFLSAMAREKEICQKIDGDKIYDSTVKMLMPVCESIERKVDRAILIPEGVTNGDMMKAMFSDSTKYEFAIEDNLKIATMFVNSETSQVFYVHFDLDWWNAPCKKSEGVNETI